jgi:hypothetical protein
LIDRPALDISVRSRHVIHMASIVTSGHGSRITFVPPV